MCVCMYVCMCVYVFRVLSPNTTSHHTMRSGLEVCGLELATMCINWGLGGEESPLLFPFLHDITGMTSSPCGQAVPVIL